MRKQFIHSALILALLTIMGTALPALQASALPAAVTTPGNLDRDFAGFASNGFMSNAGASTKLTDGTVGGVGGMALMPDGRIVIVDHRSPMLGILRYLPNGDSDRTFGNFGYAQLQHPDNQYDLVPYDVAVQADGKIVVVGRTRLKLDDPASNFLLVRLTADGQLDTTFDGDTNGNGYVETGFYNNYDTAYRVLIQPDGKIVVVGEAAEKTNSSVVKLAVVARYDTNGSFDPAFGGGDGAVAIEGNLFSDMALQSDGKLVLAGATSSGSASDFALARLSANGSLDDTSDGDGGFDGDGKLTTDFGADSYKASAVVVQADGRLIALGYGSNSNSYMARYLPNGALDPTFAAGGPDGNGKLTLPDASLIGLALQLDGKLVAVGHRNDNTDPRFDFAFYRLLPNGALDLTFDGDGIAAPRRSSSPKYQYGTNVALLPDGRILGFGVQSNDKVTFNSGLVRLWSDGSRDKGGQQTHSIAPGSYEKAYALAIQPGVQTNGTILVAGEMFTPPGFTSSNAFVTRFDSRDGLVDTSFGVQGTIQTPPLPFITPNARGARAIALQPDGKIVIAGYTDFGDSWDANMFVFRWNSNGTPDADFGFNGWKLVAFPGNGDDYGTAMALAPDGKIVVAGNAWNGSRQVWGVARLTSAGALDTTFGPNHDGMAYVHFNGPNSANTVVVQPDGKIIVGGHYNNDFFLQRLLENGLPDPSFGINGGGYNFTDFGGNDSIGELALAPNGWLYAAGSHSKNGNVDMALAQYRPDGTLAQCPSGQTCNHWPEGKRLVNLGSFDTASSLVLREDNQLIAAGCSGSQMAAAQLSTTDINAPPLQFLADFAGENDCAFDIQFGNTTRTKIVLAGGAYGTDGNIALARFQAAEPAKLAQTITFPLLSNHFVSDPPFTISASASSGLAVSLTSDTPGICTVSGTTVALTGQSGTCFITAKQAGDATYAPALNVTRASLIYASVGREQTISIEPDPLPEQLVRGEPFTLDAKTSSGLPVEIVSTTPEICAVDGATVVGLAEGICEISVSQTGDREWNPMRVDLRFTISPPGR